MRGKVHTAEKKRVSANLVMHGGYGKPGSRQAVWQAPILGVWRIPLSGLPYPVHG